MLKPILSVGIFVLIVLSLYRGLRGFESNRISFTNDIALTYAVVHNMDAGELPLAGPPSHRGGRHLGPVYYWAEWLVWRVSGRDIERAVRCMAVLKILALLAIPILASRFARAGDKQWTIFIGMLLLYLSGAWSIVRTPWHGHFIVIPSVLTLWAFIRTVERKRFAFLSLLLATSLLVQTHLAGAVLGATLVLSTLITYEWRERREFFDSIFPKVALICILALLWIPFLLFQLKYPGVLLQLMHAVADSHVEPIGLKGAIKTDLFFLSDVILGLGRIESSNFVRWISSALLIVTSAGVVWSLWERFSSQFRVLILNCFAAGFLFLIALSRQQAPLEHYLFIPFLPFVFTVISNLAADSARTLLSLSEHPRKNRIAAMSLMAVLLVCCGKVIVRFRNGPPAPAYHSLQNAREIAGLISADVIGNYADPKLRLGAKFMRNSYLFFLGPDYFSEMKDAQTLVELPQFRKRIEGERKPYFIVCPKPFSREFAKLVSGLAPLKLERELKLSGLLSSKECYVSALSVPSLLASQAMPF